MAKHGGCFCCGSMAQEILVSRPTMGVDDAFSVALCDACFKLDDRTLRLKVRQIEEAKREAMRKIREAQANG